MKKNFLLTISTVLAGILAIFNSYDVKAGDTLLMNSASKCEIFAAMKIEAGECGLITLPSRGIKMITKDSDAAQMAQPEPENKAMPQGKEKASTISSLSFTNITFGANSSNLTDEAREQLDVLASVFKDERSSKQFVTIIGHTDAVGSDSYNNSLSQLRAKAVYDYLETSGVSSSRMKWVGYGKQKPLIGVAPDSPSNRRVEFSVTSIGG